MVRARGRHRWEWLALGALVAGSTGLRAWAALEVPVPWIAPDEMIYGLVGQSLYRGGDLAVLGGPTPFYSFLSPAFVGLPLSLDDLGLGYDLLKVLQALVMSLAAVPVYLWGRSLLSKPNALVAATLTLAAPGLVYSGLVMTEVLFYPLLVLAAWATAAALTKPTRRRQALLVLAIAAAAATRLQAIVLLPVFVTALGLDAALARSTRNLRRVVPAAAGLAVLTLVWVTWRLASGTAALGGYEVVANTSYGIGDGVRFVLYHTASVLILAGLFPVCALVLLLVGGLQRGETEPAVRAYLAVAASLSLWFVVEVGVFASRHSDRIVERNLIGLAPVLFLGLLLWFERGAPGSYVERAIVALAAAAVLLVLPVKHFVNSFATHDAPTMIPLYKLLEASSPETLVAVYSGVAGAGAAAFALLPRRTLRALPWLLLVFFVAASIVSSRFFAHAASARKIKFLGAEPRWVDRAADGPVAYVYDGEPSWPGVWETVFWNRRIDRVYDLPDAEVPGPLPQHAVQVKPDGRVVAPDGRRSPIRYAVVATWFTLVGQPVAQATQSGLTQAGLTLWKIEPPMRILTRTTGVKPNGDIFAGGRAQVAVYDCTRGRFRLTFLIKEPETIDLVLNGKRVRHLRFPSLPVDRVWRGTVPVTSHRGGTCFLQIRPTGLLGTTVLAFERS